ncbi:ROK family protein [Krasilnikovia sp. M28-CT-15]|uniref:ROK family protein n=1 Tax=Krasilnikovia sp. M28-CT-15 TaxID=3373540 RepID=UPI0038778685
MDNRMSGADERTVTVFDIGGTYLRWAQWSPVNGLGAVGRTASPSRARFGWTGVDELRSMLINDITARVPAGATAGVSLGAALDHRTGTVYASAPLWGPHATPFDMLGALQAARPDVRWQVVNDVTAALRHLASSERGHGVNKLLLATISTGIACRTIDLRTGTIPVDGSGLQGEIGHLPTIVLIDEAPVRLRCDCGQMGHVAAYSSGPGMRRLAEVLRIRRGRAWEASAIGVRLAGGAAFETALQAALDAGDAVATELLDAATGPVADIVRTAFCLDPDVDLVALTGGVGVGLGARYRESLLRHLSRAGLYLTSERDPAWMPDRILVCAEGDADGLVGAGLAALAALPEPAASEELVRQ